MDYEKYYKLMPDGTYCIHFPNKKGFSEEKIREIFSLYGNILSVYWRGDINGLIFIRYQTLKEVLSSLQNLEESDDIRILPQKNKINKQNIQNNSNEWQARRMDSPKNLSPKLSSNNDNIHRNKLYSNFTSNYKTFACEEKPICNRSNSNCSNKPDYASNISNDSSPKLNSVYNVNAVKPGTLTVSILNDKYLQCSKQQNYKEPYDNQVTKHKKTKSYEPSKPETNADVYKDTFDNSRIPSLVSDPEVKPNISDTKFDHSLGLVWNENTLTKSKYVMQEVIVANIHADYGVHYVLHLFEKCSPVSATFVKTILKTDIRYCLVYFINIDDALAIEKKFDKYELSGKNLIVLRTSQLNKAICK
ncbi:uncharacterized protein LOC112588174 [Harpegnathos saltator]|uniref:uncharacterized protein LOC112588174 n=1 Tax=Harpegnathos saltator TaxID=610380 RepID=UPI000DBEEBC4|nr:uncharacterized protein LOC112588174 [Harpegnathos saltator]